jgi:hypothetical protein
MKVECTDAGRMDGTAVASYEIPADHVRTSSVIFEF